AAAELQRQTDRLVELGYPRLAGISEDDLRRLVDPLAAGLDGVAAPDPEDRSRVPFVLVVTRDLVDPYDTVPLLRLQGRHGLRTKPGRVDRNHAEGDLGTYDPLEELGVPDARAYVLLDVERGEEFCNVRPEDAMPVLRERGRTPLTIDEGV